MQFNFDNSYARLPENFYQSVNPVPVQKPEWLLYNHALAASLGLSEEIAKEDANIFAGNNIPEGAEPIALAYAGHQFGHFVPQLGDGRAVLLGEHVGSGRWDIQLKGSGQTQFSRNGDGRAAIGPVLREYIVSEFMHAMGIATTRSLAAVTTGEPVYRETALAGAVLTRVASSHIRVGTFEYYAAQGDTESTRVLADYVIDRHYSELDEGDYLDLLKSITERQAELVSNWMAVGFVHGVMNTDNCSIAGETIDYGPCAFMDAYDPKTVFSSIDRYGRYSYQNQGPIAQWNLGCLANALIPIMGDDQEQSKIKCEEILQNYMHVFNRKLKTKFLSKIGMQGEAGFELVQNLLELMHKYQADFTLSFRYLARFLDDSLGDVDDWYLLFDDVTESKPELVSWVTEWLVRIDEEDASRAEIASKMLVTNPAYIPRNHKVESALELAQSGEMSQVHVLLDLAKDPYRERSEHSSYMQPPADKDVDYVTYCGT